MGSIFLICWFIGFACFTVEMGDYAMRRTGKGRVLAWLGIVCWPVVLFYLWVRHYVVPMFFNLSR